MPAQSGLNTLRISENFSRLLPNLPQSGYIGGQLGVGGAKTRLIALGKHWKATLMSDATGIYLRHFGLERRPFALVPNAEFMYWSESHRQAFSILEYGILSCVPITVVTGEIGAGKTTILRELLARIADQATVGLISNAQGDRGELLHWVLMSLKQTVSNEASYVQLFHQFQDFLIAEYAAGRRTVLIFDEAQNLSLESLEELRMFSNINADSDELLQLILVGQPNLYEKLARPELEQFTQRIGAEYHLPTLNAEEVEKYIAHRLKVAGTERPIFSQAACESIHLATKGTPRVINRLCDYALLYAFAMDRDTVDAAIVQQVILDQKVFGFSRAASSPQSKARTLGSGDAGSADLRNLKL